MNNKSCIFILADGARADIFEYLLANGELPNISEYIVDKGSYSNGVTVFPSTTGPAYTPYLLGKFPGRCNLPGIRWFDRYQFDQNRFSLKCFRSYIGPETYMMNRDLDTNGTPTLFELLPRSVSILNELTRGLSNNGDKTKFMKVFLKIKSHFTDSSNEVDEAGGRILLNSLKENPKFIFCVFMGIDTYSHQFHPFHKKVINSYKFIDSYVGDIAKYLIKENKLDDTLIIIGSDHGLTPTHSHFDSPLFMDKLGYKTLYHTNIFNHFLDADASVMVSGNSMAHIYIKSKDGWKRNAFMDESEKVVNELLGRKEIDIVAGIRSDMKLGIKSTRGEAYAWCKNGSINYQVAGSDPFGYKNIPKKLNPDQAYKLSYDSNYPDAIVQLLQLFESSRTGDLIISAKPGIDLRVRNENPEHCGSHGSLVRDHMMVPIVLSKKTKNKYVRSSDIYPTILKHLDIEIPHGIDGKSLI